MSSESTPTKKVMLYVLYAIGLLMALASLILSYTGLPEPYDIEPVLALGLLLVAVAGMASIKD